MYKSLLISLFCFSAIARTAPAASPLDSATLLKNGEDAQALNRQFKTLKATDACQGDDVSCIGDAIAKCLNGSWETSRGKCSKTQSCFALPSVKKEGTSITCTSQRSAEGLIDATGAKGGIFGNDTSEQGADDGDATGRVSDTPVSYGTAPSTSSIAPEPTRTNSEQPSSTPTVAAPNPQDNNGDVTASQSPCTMKESSATIPEPTPTLDSSENSNSSPPYAEPTSKPSSAPAAEIPPPPQSSAAVNTVTVTLTLAPSQVTTLPPQTRTITPEEASILLSSVLAAGGLTTVAPAPASSTSLPISTANPAPAVVYTSAPASPSSQTAIASSPASIQGGYGGYSS